MKNTNTATNLQLVMIPISENIGTAIPLGNSFTGNAHKAKMVTSPDGRFLALSYSKGISSGWFNATKGGNEIRTYQLDTDYTTATDLGAQAIPEVADIHSMRFNADCSYMYYTASSETDGHKLYRIETTANAVPEALEVLGGYAELSTDKNGRFYAVVSNTNILKTITHSATPQVTDITLDLPAGYTLTGAMPLQPHRIYANENVDDIYVRTLGNKQYELKDHLGNVRAVISDRKLSTLSGTIPSDFNADLLASYNYYPFGMNMPGRTYNPSEYRYGFQGQETDPETGLVNYKYRMHDPRIGRFFAIDPVSASYPHNSPYAFSENRIIDGVELEGAEYIHYWVFLDKGRNVILKYTVEDFRDMSVSQIIEVHNMTSGDFYKKFSQSFGKEGRGVKYTYWTQNEDGAFVEWGSMWEQHQSSSLSLSIDNLQYHGMFAGEGCVTKCGPWKRDRKANPYDFNESPIDEVDGLAQSHDIDYGYPGYIPGSWATDYNTLLADYVFVDGLKKYLERAKKDGYIDVFSRRAPSTEAKRAAKNAIRFFENYVIPKKERLKEKALNEKDSLGG